MKTVLKNSRSALALTHDVAAACVAWVAAYLLRFNFEIPPEHVAVMVGRLWLVVMIQTGVFIGFGLYRGTWRFASIADLKRILFTVTLSTAVLGLLLFMMATDLRVPRSVMILAPILLVLMMGGSRFFYRAFKEHQLYGLYSKRGEPVVVLGAGEAAVTRLKDLAQLLQSLFPAGNQTK